jgi:hypothetical protein
MLLTRFFLACSVIRILTGPHLQRRAVCREGRQPVALDAERSSTVPCSIPADAATGCGPGALNASSRMCSGCCVNSAAARGSRQRSVSTAERCSRPLRVVLAPATQSQAPQGIEGGYCGRYTGPPAGAHRDAGRRDRTRARRL